MAMRRICKELRALRTGTDQFQGQVDVSLTNPSDASVLRLILSPNDGPFSGCSIRFSVTFPPTYPRQAPTVKCLDNIFHPNVSTNSICFSMFSGQWNEHYGIDTIANGLLFLLSNPNHASPLRSAAVRHTPEEYIADVIMSAMGLPVKGTVYSMIRHTPFPVQISFGRPCPRYEMSSGRVDFSLSRLFEFLFTTESAPTPRSLRIRRARSGREVSSIRRVCMSEWVERVSRQFAFSALFRKAFLEPLVRLGCSGSSRRRPSFVPCHMGMDGFESAPEVTPAASSSNSSPVYREEGSLEILRLPPRTHRQETNRTENRKRIKSCFHSVLMGESDRIVKEMVFFVDHVRSSNESVLECPPPTFKILVLTTGDSRVDLQHLEEVTLPHLLPLPAPMDPSSADHQSPFRYAVRSGPCLSAEHAVAPFLLSSLPCFATGMLTGAPFRLIIVNRALRECSEKVLIASGAPDFYFHVRPEQILSALTDPQERDYDGAALSIVPTAIAPVQSYADDGSMWRGCAKKLKGNKNIGYWFPPTVALLVEEVG